MSNAYLIQGQVWRIVPHPAYHQVCNLCLNLRFVTPTTQRSLKQGTNNTVKFECIESEFLEKCPGFDVFIACTCNGIRDDTVVVPSIELGRDDVGLVANTLCIASANGENYEVGKLATQLRSDVSEDGLFVTVSYTGASSLHIVLEGAEVPDGFPPLPAILDVHGRFSRSFNLTSFEDKSLDFHGHYTDVCAFLA